MAPYNTKDKMVTNQLQILFKQSYDQDSFIQNQKEIKEIMISKLIPDHLQIKQTYKLCKGKHLNKELTQERIEIQNKIKRQKLQIDRLYDNWKKTLYQYKTRKMKLSPVPGINDIDLENGNTRLIDACYINDSLLVQTFIQAGADVNQPGNKQTSALIQAVKLEYHGIIDILIQAGANIDHTDHLGNTPLHYACQYDSYDIVVTLLTHHASPHVTNKYGRTPSELTTEPKITLLFDEPKEDQTLL